MRAVDIIIRKRDGEELSPDEIRFFVNGVVRGEIDDYQTAAWLMSIYLRGMTGVEQSALAEAMLRSGGILDFTDIPKPKADKHSTGGVGDKTSLLVAPFAASAGVCVPMICGRGLGHTGGTLDKLECIPGYRVDLSYGELRSVLDAAGFAINGQTKEIAPADRKLYALRDVTGTVESIPLIVSSIISKKRAAGLDAVLFDVKTGSGALIRDPGRARELAHALVATGNALGMSTQALITDMNQPLGRAVGNAVEVHECIQLLRGDIREGAQPVLSLSIELAARMVVMAGLASTMESAIDRVRKAHGSGAALECFRRNVEAQGGDPRVCDDPLRFLPMTQESMEVKATRSGFVSNVNTREIGLAIATAGGGRLRIEDQIDPAVGFLSEVKIGAEVHAGDAIGVVCCGDRDRRERARARIQAAYEIGDSPPAELPTLIQEVIEK